MATGVPFSKKWAICCMVSTMGINRNMRLKYLPRWWLPTWQRYEHTSLSYGLCIIFDVGTTYWNAGKPDLCTLGPSFQGKELCWDIVQYGQYVQAVWSACLVLNIMCVVERGEHLSLADKCPNPGTIYSPFLFWKRRHTILVWYKAQHTEFCSIKLQRRNANCIHSIPYLCSLSPSPRKLRTITFWLEHGSQQHMQCCREPTCSLVYKNNLSLFQYHLLVCFKVAKIYNIN